MTATALRAAAQPDHGILEQLNRDYIASVQRSDVQRFEQILGDDFHCSRLMDDFAIIHARTVFTRPDGSAGGGRYTDVWAKRGGRWLAVSAHVTRL